MHFYFLPPASSVKVEFAKNNKTIIKWATKINHRKKPNKTKMPSTANSAIHLYHYYYYYYYSYHLFHYRWEWCWFPIFLLLRFSPCLNEIGSIAADSIPEELSTAIGTSAGLRWPLDRRALWIEIAQKITTPTVLALIGVLHYIFAGFVWQVDTSLSLSLSLSLFPFLARWVEIDRIKHPDLEMLETLPCTSA